ncbi:MULTISPECIES: N-acetyl sugar amidotransferase [Shewanella]|uniref:N-acetyl sugar amidotransferase n=1 Tax=Shewanella TaxID=22 RepID=UPI001BC31BB9|nr:MULTISPECIES: N-acetyl sugar amidotransferase [Shewanella]GIU50567.1 flagellin modification protein, PseA [Shewanella sp. KT0246]
MVKQCPTCLYNTAHPFGLALYQNTCSGCDTHLEKYQIDWQLKRGQLETLLEKHKSKNNSYDCVVPVVGDADDYYVLEKVLELGLSPLVVCVNNYFNNDIGWYNLHNLITHFDVDSFVFNPDIRVYKDLVRTSLRKFDHIQLPFHALHTSFPVHVANERNIPLVIWGGHQAIEQVGKFTHHDRVEMSQWSRLQHDMCDISLEELIGNGAQIDLRHLNYYQYPNISSLSKKGVTGIYLSNYFKWDPLLQNKAMVEHGFQPQLSRATFDCYERAGSSVYYELHDILKYQRTGYRKVTDQLTREIRHGRVTLEQATELAHKYQQQPANIKPFFKWLDVTESGYDWYVKHRLGKVKHLIQSDVNEAIPPTPKLPESLSKMMSPSFSPKEHHLYFAKGISI